MPALRSSSSNGEDGGVACGLSQPSALNPRDIAAIRCGGTVCDKATQVSARPAAIADIDMQIATTSRSNFRGTAFQMLNIALPCTVQRPGPEAGQLAIARTSRRRSVKARLRTSPIGAVPDCDSAATAALTSAAS